MKFIDIILSSISQKVYAVSSTSDLMQPAYGVDIPERHVYGRLPIVIKVVLTIFFLLLGVLFYNKKYNKKKKIVIFVLLALVLAASIVLVYIIYNYLLYKEGLI